MFEKSETGTADGLAQIRGGAARFDLTDHRGAPGTGLRLGLDLAGHLRPQDHRGLGEGAGGLGVLPGTAQLALKRESEWCYSHWSRSIEILCSDWFGS